MTTSAHDTLHARLIVRVLLQVGETTHTVGDAELGDDLSVLRALLAPPTPSEAGAPLSLALRERIMHLCARLGERAPAADQLTEREATALVARLEAEEEELLRTAAQARTQPDPARDMPPVDLALIRHLKHRWRAQYQLQGEVEELQRAWGTFKQQICGEAIADRAITAQHYERLLAALASSPPERTSRS